VQPSFETLRDLVRAAGFDIPLDLVPYVAQPADALAETARLTPQERLQRLLERRREAAGGR
jgi:hypothetical protein